MVETTERRVGFEEFRVTKNVSLHFTSAACECCDCCECENATTLFDYATPREAIAKSTEAIYVQTAMALAKPA
jgi:uncharacterized protein (DUF39 family)